jgi:hypothetical protein
VRRRLAAFLAPCLHAGSRGIGLFFGWAGQAVLLAGLAWAAWMVRRRKVKRKMHVILSAAKDLILVNPCNEQDEILRPEPALERSEGASE